MTLPTIRVLLVDDDEEDYIFARANSCSKARKSGLRSTGQLRMTPPCLQWSSDAYVIDYRPDGQDGLDLSEVPFLDGSLAWQAHINRASGTARPHLLRVFADGWPAFLVPNA